jgi:hypothetical protein
MNNRKRIAALVRLLASDQDGEVLNAAAALKRICSLNEIGDIIETGGTAKISNDEMQKIWDHGFEEGYETGLKKAKSLYETVGVNKNNKSREGIFGNPGEDGKKALYCQKHKNVLKKSKEKEFVDDMVNWTIGMGRPLSPAQASWLNSICSKLQSLGLK